MSDPTYKKAEVNPPASQNLLPYSDCQPSREPGLSAPNVGYGAPPPMPPQYQPSYGAPGAVVTQAPVLLPPTQTIVFTAVQPLNEPDYLCYSIFTMLCCCLPVGIAALVYSVKTQNANNSGNRTTAQQYSRLARTLGHTALGLGIGIGILYIILKFTLGTPASTSEPYNPYYPRQY